MPRVKRGTVRRAKRKKLLARAKGFFQTKSKLYRVGQGVGRHGAQVRLRRPPPQEARLPPAVDRPHQRRRARARPVVQRLHQGPRGRRRDARPQDAGRPRRARAEGVRGPRRAGEGRPSRRRVPPPSRASPMDDGEPGRPLGARSRPSSRSVSTPRDLQSLRDRYLGRKAGRISGLYAELADGRRRQEARARAPGSTSSRPRSRPPSTRAPRRSRTVGSPAAAARSDAGRPARRSIGHVHPLTYLRTRIEAYFAARRLRDPRRSGDRGRLPQLRSAEPARRAPGARHAGHALPREAVDRAPVVPGRRRPDRRGSRRRAGVAPPRRATSAPRRCCGRTPRRCRSATWSGTSRRCGSSARAASIAATTWIRRTRRCSSRSKAWWSAKA